MIKVIASDLDGTLLNENHEITEESYRAIRLAKEQGIRFIISTGRSYKEAMKVIDTAKIDCDYIYFSGAEIRDSNNNIVKQVPMDQSVFDELYERLSKFSVGIDFCSDEYEYMVGTKEEVKGYLKEQVMLFPVAGKSDNNSTSTLLESMVKNVICIEDISQLRENNIPVFKIFISSSKQHLMSKIEEAIADIPRIASASSFAGNLELTHIDAQKGFALKEYTKKLGYSMDEVMVLGDSMNDYSMLSQNFGVTVAMENAMEELKKPAKYITKSNKNNGVAYAIHKLLNEQLDDLKIKR